MPDPLDTLEDVAQLLPEERRERFYSLMARLQNVPEDDPSKVKGIWQDLRGIAAFPITPGQKKMVLGTINFDSSVPCEALGWHQKSKLVEIGRQAAAAVWHILRQNIPVFDPCAASRS